MFKKNGINFFAIVAMILGLTLQIWNTQPVFYAHAYVGDGNIPNKMTQPSLLDSQSQLFEKDGSGNNPKIAVNSKSQKQNQERKKDSGKFAQKLYDIVGDSPIKEMVPFISQRNEKVAAFLVGIAKKESSWGQHSPLQNGQDCHNYWGYKGSAGNGSAMGYACFASAEEAVEIVGNRIEVLVNKNRSTPSSMVNTWKCGTDCRGDLGAPSWVSTVALYFNKIVS